RGVARTVLAVGGGFLALLALAIATGFGLHGQPDEPADSEKKTRKAPAKAAAQSEEEEHDEDDAEKPERTSVSLGFIVHALLSLKARFVRLFSRERPGWFKRDATPNTRARTEPRFDEYQSALSQLEQ